MEPAEICVLFILYSNREYIDIFRAFPFPHASYRL